MELTINHQKKSFDQLPPSLEQLLIAENLLKDLGIAVAVNNSVVPRNLWATTPLQPNDNILIITATQGG
ncbi:sulfur carrier protein ThiS [Capnocytophaga sp. ARDL2]|uniref:sulfur carrier protein ThiS n=1 Tax=Capnocytophaga sp. ARDL2 TaxID=3238809 RepID=UPI0035581182